MKYGSKQWNDDRRFRAKVSGRDAREKREAAQDLDSHVERVKQQKLNSNNTKDPK